MVYRQKRRISYSCTSRCNQSLAICNQAHWLQPLSEWFRHIIRLSLRHLVGFNLLLHSSLRRSKLMHTVLPTLSSLVDYFVLRKALVKVSDLLKKDESSIYWYRNGFGWRAIIAVLGAAWLPFRKSRIYSFYPFLFDQY